MFRKKSRKNATNKAVAFNLFVPQPILQPNNPTTPVADPGARVWTYWKNCYFQRSIVFLFVVDFILRSFLFTHIEIVILTTKKYFLHRALLFSLWVVKLYFCCSEWANELHNVNSARPSGLAKYYHRSELSVLITSQLKIKLIPEQKVRRFEGKPSAERPYSKRALLEEGIVYIASVFKVLQGCDVRWFAGKFCIKDIRQEQYLHITSQLLSLRFAQYVRSVQNNISKSALHRSVCIIASLLGIKL